MELFPNGVNFQHFRSPAAGLYVVITDINQTLQMTACMLMHHKVTSCFFVIYIILTRHITMHNASCTRV